MRNGYRNFIALLDEKPRIESAIEIIFTTVISISPFLLASVFALANDDEFSKHKYWSTFYSYFDSGELSLLILAICGSIIWITLVRQQGKSLIGRSCIALLIVIVALFIGGLVGQNPGFKDMAPSWLLRVVLGAYVLVLILWFLVSVSQKSPAGTKQRPEDKADAIREQARSEGEP